MRAGRALPRGRLRRRVAHLSSLATRQRFSSLFDYRTFVRFPNRTIRSHTRRRQAGLTGQNRHRRHARHLIASNDDRTCDGAGRIRQAETTAHAMKLEIRSEAARQLRQKVVAHVVAGDACRVGGEVQAGDRLAAAVDDRHGDRAQTPLELLVDDGEPLLAVGLDAIEERLRLGDRLRRVGLEPERHQPPPDLGVLDVAELHAPKRGVECRQPRADRHRHRHDAARRHARDVDDLRALQDRGGAGFLHARRKLLQKRRRLLDPALRGEIAEAEFEDLRRQRELPAVLLDVAERGQRAQNAPRRRAREIGDRRGLRQRHRRALAGEGAHDGQPLGERRHELAVFNNERPLDTPVSQLSRRRVAR